MQEQTVGDKIKQVIPNLFTIFNLFCGCASLVFLYKREYELMWMFAFAGGIADVLDGLVARVLNAYSELGKQLDSMADLITSGILPGAIMFVLLEEALQTPFGNNSLYDENIVIQAMPAFLISMFAAIRLAKFNIDESQEHEFRGMPVPAAMIFVVGLLMAAFHNTWELRDFIMQPTLLYALTVLISYLFVSNVKMFSVKFKGFRWKGNEVRILYITYCFSTLAIWGWGAISSGIIVYVVLSLIMNLTGYFNKRKVS